MKTTVDETPTPRKPPLLRTQKNNTRPAPAKPTTQHTGIDTRLLKVVWLAVITSLLLFPLMWVHHWLDDRETNRQAATDALTQTWGGSQAIIAPLLLIPYTEHITQVDSVTDKDGETRVISKDIYNNKTAIFLPETLTIAADLQEQQKAIGKHTALVYDASISLSGRFDHSSLQETETGDIDINWDQAKVIAGLSDTTALEESSYLRWGEDNTVLEPGTGRNELSQLLKQGVHAPLDRTSANNDAHDFKLTLKFQGSGALTFAPLGRLTTLRITSPWQQPDFQGAIPPKDYKITEKGFTANWEIPHLARDYPQRWIQNSLAATDNDVALDNSLNLGALSTGVQLSNEPSRYAPVAQTLTYAILFIVLGFAVFFALESMLKQQLTPLHYAILGASLLAFYPLLLTITDHLRFTQAYSIAATSVITLIGLYAWLLFRHWGATLSSMIVLTGLYGMFYIMQQQPDVAPLIATALGITALALLMFVTRIPKQHERHMPQE